jgi:hypothetical protein
VEVGTAVLGGCVAPFVVGEAAATERWLACAGHGRSGLAQICSQPWPACWGGPGGGLGFVSSARESSATTTAGVAARLDGGGMDLWARMGTRWAGRAASGVAGADASGVRGGRGCALLWQCVIV